MYFIYVLHYIQETNSAKDGDDRDDRERIVMMVAMPIMIVVVMRMENGQPSKSDWYVSTIHQTNGRSSIKYCRPCIKKSGPCIKPKTDHPSNTNRSHITAKYGRPCIVTIEHASISHQIQGGQRRQRRTANMETW